MQLSINSKLLFYLFVAAFTLSISVKAKDEVYQTTAREASALLKGLTGRSGINAASPEALSFTNLDIGSDSSTSPDSCVSWEVFPSPNAGTINDQLSSVTGISANEAWTVGWYQQGDLGFTLTEHWNGTNWSVVPSPNPLGSGALYGVTAVGTNDVWAVGLSGGISLILRWNGTNWAVVPSPNPGVYANRLFEVRAVNANDVWAVGNWSDCRLCPDYTLIEHWDGTSWSVVSSPNPSMLGQKLSGLAVISASEVWAAGFYYLADGTARTLTMRWDGSTWTVIPSPNSGSGSNFINRMSLVPSAAIVRNLWAVGFECGYQCQSPEHSLALYWDGTQWSIVSTPNVGTCGSPFAGVAAASAQDVWAVGGTNDIWCSDGNHTMVQHWDGTSWTIIPSQNPGIGGNGLNYVVVTPTGNPWAVGGYYNTAYNYRTLVERPVSNCGTK